MKTNTNISRWILLLFLFYGRNAFACPVYPTGLAMFSYLTILFTVGMLIYYPFKMSKSFKKHWSNWLFLFVALFFFEFSHVGGRESVVGLNKAFVFFLGFPFLFLALWKDPKMKLYISTTLFTILFVLNSSPDFSWSKSPFLYGGRPKSITSEGRLKLSAIYSAFSSFHTDYNTYDVESYLNKNPEVSFPGQQGLTFLGYDPTMGVSRFASGIFPNSRIQNGKKKNLEGYIFPTTGDGFLSNSENVVNLVSKICADCTAGESRYKAFSIMNYTRGEDSEVYFYTIDQNKNLELERLGRLDELLKKFKIIPVVPVPVPAPVNNPTFSDRASGYYQSYKYVVLMILVYLVGVFSIRQLFLREEDYR